MPRAWTTKSKLWFATWTRRLYRDGLVEVICRFFHVECSANVYLAVFEPTSALCCDDSTANDAAAAIIAYGSFDGPLCIGSVSRRRT